MDTRILYTAALIGSAPKLIPALQSCFEDFDTSMRELSISCLEALLRTVPMGSLSQTVAHGLYPAIVKRLDDSIDTIRVYTCRAFVAFLKASESEGLIGTPLEFCAEQLLVHLDDPSAEIQMAVFDALRQMICFDQLAAMAVANKIKDVHASHRDPSLCHQLLKEAALHDKSP